jgi:hypothetical protein
LLIVHHDKEPTMKTRLASLAVLILSLSGCGKTPTDATAIATIRATTAFGFCVGYCRTSLDITAEQAVFVKQSLRGELPDVRRTLPITAAEWKGLVDAVDRKRLEALPAVVGCPDCADGGAESVEVVGADWRKGVSFDHGANLTELQPLLGRVRAVRNRFGS